MQSTLIHKQQKHTSITQATLDIWKLYRCDFILSSIIRNFVCVLMTKFSTCSDMMVSLASSIRLTQNTSNKKPKHNALLCAQDKKKKIPEKYFGIHVKRLFCYRYLCCHFIKLNVFTGHCCIANKYLIQFSEKTTKQKRSKKKKMIIIKFCVFSDQ